MIVIPSPYDRDRLCPIAHADGHDRSGSIDELVPSGNAGGLGAWPRTLVCTLASRKASKALECLGDRQRATPHWAKKKPPAGRRVGEVYVNVP